MLPNIGLVFFQFRHFSIQQDSKVHAVGTDSMILGAILTSSKTIHNLLDIGTGTGVLALMCAQQFSTAEIIGIDTDNQSVELAAMNFKNSNWSHRLTAIHSSLNDFYHSEKFDLIVSNPPFYEESYFSPDENRNGQRNSESLPLLELIAQSKKLLSATGCFWFIVPHKRKDETEKLIRENHLYIHQAIHICGKPDAPTRIIYSIGLTQPNSIAHQELTIRNDEGNYTEDYKQLTQDFHNRPL
jgi:tRNA1Val (adenine37-N6)-methyltransferase